jgi:hypothetical protein
VSEEKPPEEIEIGKTHRIRRGKLVEIPPKWRGQVTHKQTRNKRQPIHRRTRKNK